MVRRNRYSDCRWILGKFVEGMQGLIYLSVVRAHLQLGCNTLVEADRFCHLHALGCPGLPCIMAATIFLIQDAGKHTRAYICGEAVSHSNSGDELTRRRRRRSRTAHSPACSYLSPSGVHASAMLTSDHNRCHLPRNGRSPT